MYFIFNATNIFKKELAKKSSFNNLFPEGFFLTENPKRYDPSFCPKQKAAISELFIQDSDGIVVEPLFNNKTGFMTVKKDIYYELLFSIENKKHIYILKDENLVEFFGEAKKLPKNLVNENSFARLRERAP